MLFCFAPWTEEHSICRKGICVSRNGMIGSKTRKIKGGKTQMNKGMKKVLSLALVAAMMLSACGNSNAGSSNEGSNAGSTNTPAAEGIHGPL